MLVNLSSIFLVCFPLRTDPRHLPQRHRDEPHHDGQGPPGVPVGLLRQPDRAGRGSRRRTGHRPVAVQPEQVLKFDPKNKKRRQSRQTTNSTKQTILPFTLYEKIAPYFFVSLLFPLPLSSFFFPQSLSVYLYRIYTITLDSYYRCLVSATSIFRFLTLL